jgi:GH15 family glucan-1,4-alpha-glucosidase
VRGPRRHFTHSKVMAWVAFDRAIKAVEQSALDGPLERWRRLRLCNDVGLLSEEYDTGARRLVGNFPQAFSHIGLVNTADNLSRRAGPAAQRLRT